MNDIYKYVNILTEIYNTCIACINTLADIIYYWLINILTDIYNCINIMTDISCWLISLTYISGYSYRMADIHDQVI